MSSYMQRGKSLHAQQLWHKGHFNIVNDKEGIAGVSVYMRVNTHCVIKIVPGIALEAQKVNPKKKATLTES